MPFDKEAFKQRLLSGMREKYTPITHDNPKDNKTILEIIGDYASRPTNAGAGAVKDLLEGDFGELPENVVSNLTGKRADKYRDVFDTLGMPKNTATDLAATGLDIVADPLIGVSKVSRALNIAGKAGSGIGKAVRATPVVGDFVKKVFKPTLGMDKSLANPLRLAASALKTAPERTVSDLYHAGILDTMTPQQVSENVARLRTKELAPVLDKLFNDAINSGSDILAKAGTKGYRSLASADRGKGVRYVDDALRQKFGSYGLKEDVIDVLDPEYAINTAPHYNAFMDWWRKWVTLNNPRFAVTNAAGNAYNMAASGINPVKAYKQGLQFNAAGKVPKGINLRPDELNQLLHKYDIDRGMTQHISYFPDDIQKTIEQIRAYENPKNPLARMNDAVERNSRVGTVLTELQKGTNLEDALIKSKDALFDYRELTPAERRIRQYIAPFYTFSRKNIPLQIKSLVESPHVPAMRAKVYDKLSTDTQTTNEYLPDYLTGTNAAEISNKGNVGSFGKALGKIPILGPDIEKQLNRNDVSTFVKNITPDVDLNYLGLPVEAISAIMGKQPTGDAATAVKQAGQLNSPLIQVLSEVMTGKDRFGNPLYDETKGLFKSTTRAVPGVELINNLVKKATGKSILPERRGQDGIARPQLPVAVNYPLEKLLPMLTMWGRPGLAYQEPKAVSDDLSWLSWLGVPVTSVEDRTKRIIKSTKDKQKQKFRRDNSRNPWVK
jgi:hypothetical protein